MRCMDEGGKERSGAPGVIRTPGLLVRSQTLYPAELRALKLDYFNIFSAIFLDLNQFKRDRSGP